MRMNLCYLYAISLLFVFVSALGTQSVHAQHQAQIASTQNQNNNQDSDPYRTHQQRAWTIASYLVNLRLNAWVNLDYTRTADVSLPDTDRIGQTGLGRCETLRNSAEAHKVLYYHLVDSDSDTVPPLVGEGVLGKIEGRACSPLFGEVLFSQDDAGGGYPAAGATNSSCFGLTGENRQARVIKDGNQIKLRGCLYVPYFGKYILLGKDGVTNVGRDRHPNWSSNYLDEWTTWQGVTAEVENDGDGATLSLRLKGCAFSVGFFVGDLSTWGFSSEENANDLCFAGEQYDGRQDAIEEWVGKRCTTAGCSGGDISDPISRTTIFAAIAPEPTIDIIDISNPGPRVGQRITFTITCAPGYILDSFKIFTEENPHNGQEKVNRVRDASTGEYTYTGADKVTYNSATGQYEYSEIAIRSILRTESECSDPREFFSDDEIPGPAAGVLATVGVRNFKAAPNVIVEGGLISFDGHISHFGFGDVPPSQCRVYKRGGAGEEIPIATSNDDEGWFEVANPNFRLDTAVPSLTEVVVQDTFYYLECQYCTREGSDNADLEKIQCSGSSEFSKRAVTGPYITSVRVLPSRLIERNVSAGKCKPEPQKSGRSKIEIEESAVCSENDNIEALNVYAIDRINNAVNEASLHKVFLKSLPENPTDKQELYPTGIQKPTVTNSEIAGKKLILEYYFTNGTRSEKVVYNP